MGYVYLKTFVRGDWRSDGLEDVLEGWQCQRAKIPSYEDHISLFHVSSVVGYPPRPFSAPTLPLICSAHL